MISDLEVFSRLAGAAMAGSLIGINRELRRKPAGLRTHAIVSLGSALTIVITLRLLGVEGDSSIAVTRSIQGIVAGVGFLGGGVILKTRDTETVTGLTTAASIWLVAALGIACGAGDWVPVIAAIVLALIVLVAGGSFEDWLKRTFPEKANLNGANRNSVGMKAGAAATESTSPRIRSQEEEE